MIIYKRIVNGVTTNQWTSDFADATYTEQGWGSASPYWVTVLAPGQTAIATQTIIDVPEVPAVSAVAAVLDANGNVVTPAVEAVAEVPAVTHLEYQVPADYVVTQTDITAQVALQAAVQKGLQAQQVGAQVVATVYAINEQNLTSGALTSAQFTAMLADATINNIERLLWNGSLATALALTQS